MWKAMAEAGVGPRTGAPCPGMGRGQADHAPLSPQRSWGTRGDNATFTALAARPAQIWPEEKSGRQGWGPVLERSRARSQVFPRTAALSTDLGRLSTGSIGYNEFMGEEPDRGGFGEFIGRWQDEIGRVWDELPPARRAEFERAIELLPGDVKRWRGLVDQAVSHLRSAVGGKSQIAIVGPVNVGKSTLYNLFVRKRGDRARVSAVPGTTRQPQLADAGLFTAIDTPGADAAGPIGQEERAKALESARQADLLLVVFDATHGIRQPEQALLGDLTALDKPMIVALNKMDVVRRERASVIGKAAATLGLSAEQVIPISAKEGSGVDRLLISIGKVEPGIVAALGEALPEYRWKLAQAVMGRAASTAAAIAVTPLPVVDFLPLIAVQSAMVLSIARIYAYRITPARARELLATFGLGILGRTLFYELAKFGGPPAWLVAAAVAGGTTMAMGTAAAVWFDRGERLSSEAMGRIARSVTQGIVGRLLPLGKRRPKRITLRQQVDEALKDVAGANGLISDGGSEAGPTAPQKAEGKEEPASSG
jgi:GTP-binding protein Era